MCICVCVILLLRLFHNLYLSKGDKTELSTRKNKYSVLLGLFHTHYSFQIYLQKNLNNNDVTVKVKEIHKEDIVKDTWQQFNED